MARSLMLKKMTRLLKAAVIQEKQKIGDEQIQEILHRGLNRRDFLQAGIAGMCVPGILAACQTPVSGESAIKPKLITPSRDFTVVGAGTAGLSCAYYLAKAGQSSRIYEASTRLGGRMQTSSNFNAEGMFCELGGEFVDTQHEDLIGLCHELGIAVETLEQNKQATLREIYFSHQKIRSEAQIIAAFRPLARRLLKDIKVLSIDGELAVPTYNSELAKLAKVRELDRMNLTEYLEKSHIEVWLQDLLANAYVGEYGLEAAEQSALNLIVLIGTEVKEGFKIFGSSDEAMRIAGGSETLPKALAKAIQSTSPIEFEHKLVAVQDLGSELKLVFDFRGKTVETLSKKLILALPVSLLKDIDMSGLALSPVKRKAIAEWGFGTNSKLMLGFSKRVWETAKIRRGFSIVPDRLAQEFWDTSRAQKGESGIITCFLGGNAGVRIDPALQGQSLDFLENFFPGVKSTFDGKKILQHWPSQVFTRGSYTCSRPGQYTSVYGAFADAEIQGKLVFAGEHCSSEWSGYMNGAVQSGKQAVATLLKTI